MQTDTLIPGLLVSLKTTIIGNVNYKVLDLGGTSDGATAIKRWETERTTIDVAEHEAAKKARSKARSLITGACVQSAFGLLCPQNKAEILEAAVREAQQIAAEFNSTARLTRVGVYVISGRVAADDEQAIKAINSEMADLIGKMREGAANLDPAVIREAANKAREISAMLTDSSRERVQAAIDLARTEARRIVKAGEQAAIAVDQSVVDALAYSRTAFLDIDVVQTDIPAPCGGAAAIDLPSAADNEYEFATRRPDTPSVEFDDADLDTDDDNAL